MKRTYVDYIGEYYDNLDKIIEWGDDIDRWIFDAKKLEQKEII